MCGGRVGVNFYLICGTFRNCIANCFSLSVPGGKKRSKKKRPYEYRLRWDSMI
jgi:hypothetical protein